MKSEQVKNGVLFSLMKTKIAINEIKYFCKQPPKLKLKQNL